MVKIALYNIGELKEVFFIIIFYTSFVLTVCIPNIKRVSRRYIFEKKNTSASVPYGHRHSSVSFSNLQRYPFSHTASTLYMNQSMMALPCKLNKNNFYVHVYKRNRNAIIYIYIYIIYRNMKTISKILNIKKNS